MCKHGVFLLGLLLVCDDQRGCFSKPSRKVLSFGTGIKIVRIR
jgi:hypothetical protein